MLNETSSHNQVGVAGKTSATRTAGKFIKFIEVVITKSGGELLEIRFLDNHLLDTFGSKSK
jgi:hypothetical protein